MSCHAPEQDSNVVMDEFTVCEYSSWIVLISDDYDHHWCKPPDPGEGDMYERMQELVSDFCTGLDQ